MARFAYVLPTPKARSEEEISPRQKRARIELDESRTRPPVCAKSTKDQKKKRKKEDRKMQVWFARLAAATTKRLDGMCRLFFPRGGRRRERCRFLFVVEPRSFGQRTRFSKKAGGDPTLLGNAKKQKPTDQKSYRPRTQIELVQGRQKPSRRRHRRSDNKLHGVAP